MNIDQELRDGPGKDAAQGGEIGGGEGAQGADHEGLPDGSENRFESERLDQASSAPIGDEGLGEAGGGAQLAGDGQDTRSRRRVL